MRRRAAASAAAWSMAGKASARGKMATASRQRSGPQTSGASSSPLAAARRASLTTGAPRQRRV
eukprot:1951166-Lingulodinium_polyedra.AAC.1